MPAPTCSRSSPRFSTRPTSKRPPALSPTFTRHLSGPPMHERSRALFERSQELIPGGVNSPVRAFRAVGGTPIFFREGRGAHLFDEDGRRYIDYVGSWGPIIL